MRIQLRRDTTTRWGFINPTLAAGEIGIDLTTRRFKLGDGTKSWTELEFGAQFLSEKGQPNGYAPLDDDGNVPHEYIEFPALPAETHFHPYDSIEAFPETGVDKLAYLAVDTLRLYMWKAPVGGDPGEYEEISGVPDATTGVKGIIKLAGDLGGDADVPRITHLKGVEILGDPAGAGRVLKTIDATHASWQVDATGGGGGGGGDDARFAHYEEDIGDGTSNEITITHGMETRQIVAAMTRKSGDCQVVNLFDIKAPSIYACTIKPDMVLDPAGWRLTLFGSIGLSDVTPPTEPTIAVAAETSNSISVTASGATDDTAVIRYNWFIKTTVAVGLPQYVGFTSSPAYVFTGLFGATEYDVACTAVDPAGNESTMSDVLTHETDVPVDIIFDAHGGPGARRNNAAGSLAAGPVLHQMGTGFAPILLAAIAVTHANANRWISYNSFGVVSDLDGAFIKVPDSSVNLNGDGASTAYGSLHWFYLLDPTPGEHEIMANWSDSVWADGLRVQTWSGFNVDQANPFNGPPVLYGAVASAAAMNVVKASALGNKTLCAKAGSGLPGTVNHTQRGDTVGSITQGFADYLNILEADGVAGNNTFTDSASTIHAASVIDLRKVT